MGILYIVATPIGNLKDITFRALEVLREVDLVVCEDTRQTVKLLNHYQISKPLVSYFQHSKFSKVEFIIGELADGKKIALVTDAGTPGISDPGGKLVEQLLRLLPLDEGRTGWGVEKENTSPSQSPPQLRGRRNSVTIIPIPGPNAAVTALSVSGFPTDKFVFMGFPPHKKGRQKFFDEVANAKYTAVFYESTHRIIKTLKQLIETRNLTERKIVVCRELTKMFESIYRGSAEEIIKILESDKNNLKGEFVVVIHGNN
jgi:16S rRNA (cytidine1402-2'-O)-methyltransferase